MRINQRQDRFAFIFKPMKKKFQIIKFCALLGVLVILNYLAARTYFFFAADYQGTDRLVVFLLFGAEVFVIIHALGYAMNIFASLRGFSDSTAAAPQVFERETAPPVAILVAARHEPKEVLYHTFSSLCHLNYPNKTVYFLDDSSDEKYKQEAEELAQTLGLVLFRRAERHGAKAGIINDCLKQLSQKYVSIFDADQCPLPDFLNALVAELEKKSNLAFVQTPQYYSNTGESRVARGAGFQQSIFYEFICEGKSSSRAMFCCGTNIVFRREALVSAGGFDESTVTEDFATSVNLHTQGWESLYYNHVYVFGLGPEDLAGYFKQQFRWAAGTITILKRLILRFIRKPQALSPMQWWEYFLSGSYYFTGLVFLIMMLCPILYLLFNTPSFFANPRMYMIFFLPYAIFSGAFFYLALGAKHYRFRDLLHGQLLNYITFPVYLSGAISALLGIKISFGITQKTKGSSVSYWHLWPQLGMIYLNLIAFSWGLHRSMVERSIPVFVNTFWPLFHFIILSSIFYFNEEDYRKAYARRFVKGCRFAYQIIGRDARVSDQSRVSVNDAVSVFLPAAVGEGAALLCKVNKAGEAPIMFNGSVLWQRASKSSGGYETHVRITNMTADDRLRLERVYDPKR